MFEQKWQNTKPPKGVLLNRGHPLAKGLVGFWLMNEGGGNKVFDLSGNNNSGKFLAGLYSPSWSSGRFGPALSFDGNDTVNLSSLITFAANTPYTVILWCYVNAWDAAYRFAISRGTSGVSEKIGTNNDAAYFLIRSVNSGASDITVSLPSAGAWHFLTLTRNLANKIDFYIDGGSPSRLYGDAAQSDIAAWGKIGDASAQYWNGKIDNVMIFNRALTAQEITWL